LDYGLDSRTDPCFSTETRGLDQMWCRVYGIPEASRPVPPFSVRGSILSPLEAVAATC
jgi:hypothetical protein